MFMTVTISLAAVVLVVLAIAAAVLLGWANWKFHVEVDPKVEEINSVLPQANCGACGYVGCAEYAEAVARGDADITLCAPGGSSCAQALARIMGVDVQPSFPYRPVVHCAADRSKKLLLREYHGEPTCTAANLVSGIQGCTYGCLGFGDCVRACKYDAIHVINGLAVVDYDKCIGCKACARVCPRNIITMVPFKAQQVLVIACSNKDFGPDVKKVCTVGCIGCKACTRVNQLFSMQGNLPTIDYDRYSPDQDFGPVLETCPMKALVVIGKPSKKDKEAVAHEEIPETVEADFKTTVDKTDWRG